MKNQNFPLKFTNNFFLSFLIVFALIPFCTQPTSAQPEKKSKVRIAISKASGGPHYIKYCPWVTSFGDDVECVDLSLISHQQAYNELAECHALLLSGGDDIHPGRYKHTEDTVLCDLEPERDTLEFALLKIAEHFNMPVLGICRGAQLMNVAPRRRLNRRYSKPFQR